MHVSFEDLARLKLSRWPRLDSSALCWLVTFFLALSSFSQTHIPTGESHEERVTQPTSPMAMSLADCFACKRNDPRLDGQKTFELTVVGEIPGKNFIVLNDGTYSACYRPKTPDFFQNHQMGDLIRVNGTITRLGFFLLFDTLEVTAKLGKGNLPSAVELPDSPSRNQVRNQTLSWVKLSGRIISAVQLSDRVRVLVEEHGFQYYVEGPALSDSSVFSSIGGELLVEGILWFPHDTYIIDSAQDIPRIFFRDESTFAVIKPAKVKFEKLSGKLGRFFNNERAYLQEKDRENLTAIRILPYVGQLEEGQFYEYWGQRYEGSHGDAVFNVVSIRRTDGEGPQTPLEKKPAPPYQLGELAQDLHRVTLQGDISGTPAQDIPKGFLLLQVDEGGGYVKVELPKSDSFVEKQLLRAARLRVTGYLNLKENRPRVFPSTFDEIEILRETPLLETAKFRWFAIGVGGLILAFLLWVGALKRVVKNRTEDLDRNLNLLNASYDAVNDGLCVFDNNGQVQKANPRFWQILGLEEEELRDLKGPELGKRFAQSFDSPDKFRALWEQLSEDKQAKSEGELTLAETDNGELNYYTAPTSSTKESSHNGRLWVFKDMSEQRRLESTLVQSQKMEAVGRLAGGVAHDFNNLLTGILGNLNIASQQPQVINSPAEQPLEAAEQAARRATELIRGLLGFSRQENLKTRPSDANAVVRELVSFVTPTLSPKIKLEMALSEGLPMAKFDPAKLEQVLLNMVVNSSDAFGSNGGRVTIQTKAVQQKHPETGLVGRYVSVSIRDNGSGIPAKIQRKVFEPFFTTKEPGKGTGLGLATSYGIIQQMSGWISCQSEEGEGTTFEIFLPEEKDIPEQVSRLDPLKTRSRTPHSELNRANFEVLCVDDDSIVRRVAESILSRAGFRICSAENGQEALDLFAERTSAGKSLPDLILTDLTMPVMDGKELLKEIRTLYQSIPVIICSGYHFNPNEFSYEAGTNADGFIQKPYEPNLILEKIDELLLALQPD